MPQIFIKRNTHFFGYFFKLIFLKYVYFFIFFIAIYPRMSARTTIPITQGKETPREAVAAAARLFGTTTESASVAGAASDVVAIAVFSTSGSETFSGAVGMDAAGFFTVSDGFTVVVSSMGFGVTVSVTGSTPTTVYSPFPAEVPTDIPSPTISTPVKPNVAVPAVGAFREIDRTDLSDVVHDGIPIENVGFAHVGAVCAINPSATVMLEQESLSKVSVPSTTHTLLPPVETPTETTNESFTFFESTDGDTVILAALAVVAEIIKAVREIINIFV
jgi:hypothetical protein